MEKFFSTSIYSALFALIAMVGIALITLMITYMLKKNQITMIIMAVLYLVPHMIKEYSTKVFALTLPGACNLTESVVGCSGKTAMLLIVAPPMLIFILGCLLAVAYIMILKKDSYLQK